MSLRHDSAAHRECGGSGRSRRAPAYTAAALDTPTWPVADYAQAADPGPNVGILLTSLDGTAATHAWTVPFAMTAAAALNAADLAWLAAPVIMPSGTIRYFAVLAGHAGPGTLAGASPWFRHSEVDGRKTGPGTVHCSIHARTSSWPETAPCTVGRHEIPL